MKLLKTLWFGLELLSVGLLCVLTLFLNVSVFVFIELLFIFSCIIFSVVYFPFILVMFLLSRFSESNRKIFKMNLEIDFNTVKEFLYEPYSRFGDIFRCSAELLKDDFLDIVDIWK